jgi:protein-S-isoprenylcysteine O-methyltransferase Ste14
MTWWSKIARRIRVPAGFVLVVFYFWLARPTWRFWLLGLIGIVPGLLLRALASGHVRKNQALATSGPYRYTRNPLYLGSLLMAIGFAIAARSLWIAAALAAIFFAIYIPVILDEEGFLRREFPDFEEYSRRVPRLLPGLTSTRHAATSSESFSLDLYRKHREYNALLGAAAMLAGLVAKMKLFRL